MKGTIQSQKWFLKNNFKRLTGFKTMMNFQKIFVFIILLLPVQIFAQQPYYFHTIHSHGLSFTGGRTARINYLYQMSRIRQLKISGTYIYDSYDQGADHIKSNIFLANAMFQYKFIHSNKFFINLALGGGGYNLVGKDILNIKVKEWRFNFVGGIQAEYYIVNNTIALTLDYDILYMPWSKIYEFVHVPTAGVTLFFF